MRRNPWFMTISIFVLVIAASARAGEPEARRQPWEYRLEERLALRLDGGARAKRVNDHALLSERGTGPAKADVVDGQVNPEAFLPFELFDSVIHKLESPQREAWWTRFDGLVRAAGLDEGTFWRDLEKISGSYLALRRQWDEVMQQYPNATAAAREDLIRQRNALRHSMCVARHAALSAARNHFGEEKFDRFLYEQIAPAMSMSFPSDGNIASYESELRARARGCR